MEFDNPLLSSTKDPASIHFVPTNAHQSWSFSRLRGNELMLRGLDISGTLDIRQETLQPSLHRESTTSRLANEIAYGEVREGAYLLLMHTLPHVLHIEIRNGIKLLTMVLIEGLSKAKKKLLYSDVSAEGTRVTQFVSDIESIVINKSILGCKDDPCQWMCPFDTKKKEMRPITMDNVRTRRLSTPSILLLTFALEMNREHHCGLYP